VWRPVVDEVGGRHKVVAETPRNKVEWHMYGGGFPKCINLIFFFFKSNPKILRKERIQGWELLAKAMNKQFTVKEGTMQLLDKDKMPITLNKASREADMAFEKARRGRRRRKEPKLPPPMAAVGWLEVSLWRFLRENEGDTI
jgi:hypothetical protein